jgi:hypothetical protein
MIFRPLPFAPILVSILCLTGCSTETTIPEDQIYQSPSAGMAVAHIKGAFIEEAGLFMPKHVGYVLMIDRQFVRDSQENWERLIPLTPGNHEISAAYTSSIFSSRASLTLEARTGVTYAVKIVPGLEGADERRYCDFSIMDVATGLAVTPFKHTYVTGGPNQSRSNFRPID